MFDQAPQEGAPQTARFGSLDGEVTLRRAEALGVTDWIGLQLQAGESKAVLHLEAGVLAEIVSAAGYDDEPGKWSAETRALAVIHLAKPLLETLGDAFGGAIAATPHKAPPLAEALGFTLNGQHFGAAHCCVTGDQVVLEKVVSLFEPALETEVDEVPENKAQSMTLVSPTFEIEMSAIEELFEGDVLLLDPDCDLFDACLVCLSDGHVAQVAHADEGFVLTSEFEPIEKVSEADPLNGPTLRFFIELETQELPAEDIEALEEGDVLPFKAGPSAWVRIMVQGYCLGTGQLVTIDGATHVRLMKVG